MDANGVTVHAAERLARNFLVRAAAVIPQQQLVGGEGDRFADGGGVISVSKGFRDCLRGLRRTAGKDDAGEFLDLNIVHGFGALFEAACER